MGVFSKLAFWKKDEPAIPKDMALGGPDLGMPGKDDFGELPGMPGMPEPGGMPKMGEGAGELGMPDLDKPAAEHPSPADTFSAPRLEGMPTEEEGPLHPGYRPPPPPGAAAPSNAAERQAASGKDLEIISLKLDSLKITLEAINERLARLEKAAEGDSEFGRRF